MRIVHNIQEVDTIDDMDRSMSSIYATLGNKKLEYQYHIIEVEGKIDNHPIAIQNYSGAIHSYIDPNLVHRIHLQ